MKKFFIGLLIGLVGLGVYSCTETVPVEPEPEPITNPDLRVEDISVDDSTPIPGQDIILSTTISNRGSESSAATILRWYRSVDATISTNGDFLEGTNAVAILLAGSDTNESITISAPSTVGTYYYGACVDAVSGETSTANNCSSGYRVTVVVPDLTVNSISVNDSTPNPGQDITLSATISNIGSESSPATTLSWYRSVDATISTNGDLLEGTNAVAILLAGSDTNESITISAPSTVGTYYYGACVEIVSGEISTVNNCSSGYRVVITEDFNTLAAAGNNAAVGIWSDGTTMWVVDQLGAGGDGKIYAYNLSSKNRDASKDINTLGADGVNRSFGLWSDGTTMWVSDWEDDKIYAYNLSNKARDASQDFNTLSAAGNNDPSGIWSDGTTMWVTDFEDDKIYAYNLSNKARDASQDFNTLSAAGNNDPSGIWSDGTTMWVTDATDGKLFAYNLSTKARDTNQDFDTLSAAGNQPEGIWSDGTTMWVTVFEDDKIYAYNLATKQRQ